MADWADLDQAFALSDAIEPGSPLRTLYNVLLVRTQNELGLLPLVTAEILLVERYLTLYVMLKHWESATIGSRDGFLTVEAAKTANQHWMSLAKEVTGLVDRARTRSDKDSVSKHAAVQVALDVICKVPDDNLRRDLIRDLAASYDRMGV